MDATLAPPLLDTVEQWRFEQLLDAGYAMEHAEKLAVSSDVDLHQAVELTRRGCSPELAAQILL